MLVTLIGSGSQYHINDSIGARLQRHTCKTIHNKRKFYINTKPCTLQSTGSVRARAYNTTPANQVATNGKIRLTSKPCPLPSTGSLRARTYNTTSTNLVTIGALDVSTKLERYRDIERLLHWTVFDRSLVARINLLPSYLSWLADFAISSFFISCCADLTSVDETSGWGAQRSIRDSPSHGSPLSFRRKRVPD
jgi:hypothetical protein